MSISESISDKVACPSCGGLYDRNRLFGWPIAEDDDLICMECILQREGRRYKEERRSGAIPLISFGIPEGFRS